MNEDRDAVESLEASHGWRVLKERINQEIAGAKENLTNRAYDLEELRFTQGRIAALRGFADMPRQLLSRLKKTE